MAHSTNCNECRAIAMEFRTALLTILSRSDPSPPPSDVQATLTALFSSEENIARLMASREAMLIQQPYYRWTEHRIATGHTVTAFSSALN
jgi:hypothetical protein